MVDFALESQNLGLPAGGAIGSFICCAPTITLGLAAGTGLGTFVALQQPILRERQAWPFCNESAAQAVCFTFADLSQASE